MNFKVYAPSLLYETVKNCQILLSLFYPRSRFFVKNYWKSKILTTFWGDVDIDSISKLESLCSSDLQSFYVPKKPILEVRRYGIPPLYDVISIEMNDEFRHNLKNKCLHNIDVQNWSMIKSSNPIFCNFWLSRKFKFYLYSLKIENSDYILNVEYCN